MIIYFCLHCDKCLHILFQYTKEGQTRTPVSSFLDLHGCISELWFYVAVVQKYQVQYFITTIA